MCGGRDDTLPAPAAGCQAGPHAAPWQSEGQAAAAKRVKDTDGDGAGRGRWHEHGAGAASRVHTTALGFVTQWDEHGGVFLP
eukprot:361174-Chlamydomonas_euryale.AAC.9